MSPTCQLFSLDLVPLTLSGLKLRFQLGHPLISGLAVGLKLRLDGQRNLVVVLDALAVLGAHPKPHVLSHMRGPLAMVVLVRGNHDARDTALIARPTTDLDPAPSDPFIELGRFHKAHSATALLSLWEPSAQHRAPPHPDAPPDVTTTAPSLACLRHDLADPVVHVGLPAGIAFIETRRYLVRVAPVGGDKFSQLVPRPQTALGLTGHDRRIPAAVEP